jgi:hypothetical protein
MELKLTVNDDLARKIKGLSVLTGKSAQDITQDLSQQIEVHINKALVAAVGLKPEDLVVHSSPTANNTYTTNSGYVNQTQYRTDQSTNNALVFADQDEEEDEYEESSSSKASDSGFSMASGLGASEEEFDKFDDELPEEAKKDFVLPGQNDEEDEEEFMPVKDKEGKEAGYSDPVMADLQAELESGGLDGVGDGGYDFEDEEKEFKEDSGIKPRARVSTIIGDDTPTGEDGYTPDVLPVDFGINSVNSETGDYKGAMDFFTNAMSGLQGDKSRRNSVSRKRLSTGY